MYVLTTAKKGTLSVRAGREGRVRCEFVCVRIATLTVSAYNADYWERDKEIGKSNNNANVRYA